MLTQTTPAAASPCQVELSPPVEIARGGGHLWFPVLYRLDDTHILCSATTGADQSQGEWPASVYLTTTAGRAWQHALDIPCYGSGALPAAPGQILLQPYELWPLNPDVNATESTQGHARATLLQRNPTGHWDLQRAPVQFLGFPRGWEIRKPNQTIAAIFHPTTLRLRNGHALGTIYGKRPGDKRFRLCCVTSPDAGRTWHFRAELATPDIGAPVAKEGPNEADIARLADGRLLCVFRVGMRQSFWSTHSPDDGLTWSPPTPMDPTLGSVLPKLLTLPNGALLLAGGRDGTYLWLNADGSAQSWQRLDLEAHHDAHITFGPQKLQRDAQGNLLPWAPTTSYTSMLALGGDDVLLVYDRLANGWKAAPGPCGTHNVLFSVRLSVRPRPPH